MIIRAPQRIYDCHGSGRYGAPRGDRTHNGIDYVCWPDSEIFAVKDGFVTKIGYPYNPTDINKGHFRYIQITDEDGFDARYFYVSPTVDLHDRIEKGFPIGLSQDLRPVYSGIIPHMHFEVKDPNGEYINPEEYS